MIISPFIVRKINDDSWVQNLPYNRYYQYMKKFSGKMAALPNAEDDS